MTELGTVTGVSAPAATAPPRAGARERRSCVRTVADDPASLKVLNPFSPSRWEIRVLDKSIRGLKLRVPGFLHPGTAVQIRLEHTIALAEVRYCVVAGAHFHVGVHFQDIFPRNRVPGEI